MGQALYRKYRSKSFSEVVGQKHITNTLEQAISKGRISHAYLFTGPRGVGKTSVARILAHVINDLPYDEKSLHLDIIEIDAASNRRIDEIRDLRDKVHIAPTSSKYKVYIIDEVHMLTREAFNALLKTLEEPPAHCIFILATTEAHKLPETILSRTQRFEFKPVGVKEAADHLQTIANQEKIQIDRPALELLAEYGEGSFRDSISLLDQLGSTGSKITATEVQEMLGLPPANLIEKLIDAITNLNSSKALQNLEQLKEQGANAATTAKFLAKEYRKLLMAGAGQPQTIQLLKRLVEVPASISPYESLEIAILEACYSASNTSSESTATKEANSTKPQPSAPKKTTVEQAVTKDEIVAPASGFNIGRWDELLDHVKNQAASLYTALRLASPNLQGDVLELSFQFPLHQKKLEQAKNKDLVAKIIMDNYGVKLAIECQVDKSIVKTVPEPQPIAAPATLTTISNIFGAAEMLES